ncbi:MAG: ATP-binding protein [Oscillibacter sp.]
MRETAESFVDFAASKGHELRLSITDGLTYRGDEYAVRQLVSILLDNAVKYALPDSPIEFSLEKAKRGVVLRSSNAREDVTPENAQKLFDRFYRADQSRSSGSGFGIGLSIARSIAEGHHGSIRAIVDDGRSPSPPSSNKRLLGKKRFAKVMRSVFLIKGFSSRP